VAYELAPFLMPTTPRAPHRRGDHEAAPRQAPPGYVTNLNGAIDKHPEWPQNPPKTSSAPHRHPEDIRKIVQNNAAATSTTACSGRS